jgi:hypothetical protein
MQTLLYRPMGSLWTATTTTTDNATVYFSDLIAGHVWSTGTSGTLNVNQWCG